MKPCACRCGRPLPPQSVTGRQQRSDMRYATPSCGQRARRRRKRTRVTARTPENIKRCGREGGKARAAGVILRLLASLAHLDRDQAILEAYRRGKYAFYRIPKAERAA